MNHKSKKSKNPSFSSTAAVPRSERVRRQEECEADVGGLNKII